MYVHIMCKSFTMNITKKTKNKPPISDTLIFGHLVFVLLYTLYCYQYNKTLSVISLKCYLLHD